MSAWFQLTVDVPADLSDRVSAHLFDIGCSGLQVEDGDDAWHARLIAYFPTEEGRDRVEARLAEALADVGDSVRVAGEAVPDTDWTTAWREHFEPVPATPRITVCAPWHEVEPPAGGIRIRIEPRTAFGTGRHPTTRMALEAVEATVKTGDRVLDVGTGSGILSIAARMLGAASVTAVDVDPLAEENVAENLGLNDIDGVTYATRSVTPADRDYDVVVANIISSILTPMLPKLAAATRPGGHVILGGLLDREEDRMRKAAADAGLTVDTVTHESEWIGIRARRPEAHA